MKPYIVYFSLNGHSKKFSNKLKKKIDADIIELKPKHRIPEYGIKKFIYGSLSATINKKAALKNYEFNNEECSHLIIVTPVWVGKLPPVFNTFFNDNIINCNITVVLSCFVEYDFILKNLENKKLKGKGKIEYSYVIYDREPDSYKKAISSIVKNLDDSKSKMKFEESHLDLLFY